MAPKKNILNLETLPEDTRKAVEKALSRRDTKLSLKFKSHSVESWKYAAEAEGITLTEWMERKLDAAVNTFVDKSVK